VKLTQGVDIFWELIVFFLFGTAITSLTRRLFYSLAHSFMILTLSDYLEMLRIVSMYLSVYALGEKFCS